MYFATFYWEGATPKVHLNFIPPRSPQLQAERQSIQSIPSIHPPSNPYPAFRATSGIAVDVGPVGVC